MNQVQLTVVLEPHIKTTLHRGEQVFGVFPALPSFRHVLQLQILHRSKERIPHVVRHVSDGHKLVDESPFQLFIQRDRPSPQKKSG